MNIQKNTRGLVESAIITAVICVLGIAGMYIPLLGLLLFAVPTPLIILGRKYGIRYAMMSLIAASVVMISFSSPVTSLFIIALPGIPALVIGSMMKKKIKPVKILAAGTFVGIGITALSLLLASNIMGVSLEDNMQHILKQSSEIQEYVYSVMGTNDEAIEMTREMMQAMNDMIAVIIPSAIIVSAFASCYLNYILSAAILKRTGYQTEGFGPFRYFRMSKNTVQGIMVIAILSIAVSYLNIVDQKTLIMNVYLLGQLIFIVEGLAVLTYYLHIYKISKPLKIIIIVFSLLSKLGAMVLLFVGIMDIFIDLRKYRSENQ